MFAMVGLFLIACDSTLLNKSNNPNLEQQEELDTYLHCGLLNEIPLSTYPVNSIIDTSQAYVVAGAYLENNAWHVSGKLTSRGASYANGNSSELIPLKVRTLIMPFNPLQGVSFRFRDYSSHINLEVNGNLLETDNLISLDGHIFDSWFDSISVEIIFDPIQASNANTGTVKLAPLEEGTITSFAIGGRALVIDDVCLAY